jgi:hypothetical protein
MRGHCSHRLGRDSMGAVLGPQDSSTVHLGMQGPRGAGCQWAGSTPHSTITLRRQARPSGKGCRPGTPSTICPVRLSRGLLALSSAWHGQPHTQPRPRLVVALLNLCMVRSLQSQESSCVWSLPSEAARPLPGSQLCTFTPLPSAPTHVLQPPDLNASSLGSHAPPWSLSSLHAQNYPTFEAPSPAHAHRMHSGLMNTCVQPELGTLRTPSVPYTGVQVTKTKEKHFLFIYKKDFLLFLPIKMFLNESNVIFSSICF